MKNLKFKKNFKRKTFFSNELKQVLFKAFVEAKKSKSYVTSKLLLYALLAQPKSLASKLVSLTLSQFRNNKALTSSKIAEQIYNLYQQDSSQSDKITEFSYKLWSENELTPWLTTEVKDILKQSILSALHNKKRVTIVTTKDVIFELLNKEAIRNSLQQLVI